MPKSRGVQEGESMYMHACYLDPVQTRDAGTFIYVHVIEKRGTLCRHVVWVNACLLHGSNTNQTERRNVCYIVSRYRACYCEVI